MRAWVIESYGGPDVLKKVAIPTPKPGPGEVLIRVAATSVNPVDYKIRSGAAAAIGPDLPARLHGDVSGVVEELGDGVNPFAVGDQVYGCVGGVQGLQGVLADYAIADVELIAHAPKSISLDKTAALPLVTLTAWEGFDKIGACEGKSVLVHGGTGGVGHVAIQLAKARGAHVTATVGSTEKAQIAQQLGADQIILYREESVAQYVDRLTDGKGFDFVFDTVGGSNIANCIEAIKPNGQIACIQGRAEIDGGALHAKGASLHLVFMLIPMLHHLDRGRHGRIMKRAAQLVDTGQLKPLIDEKKFTFEQIAEAHAHSESGEQLGKVVVVHPDHA